jgi:hypothetical protein
MQWSEALYSETRPSAPFVMSASWKPDRESQHSGGALDLVYESRGIVQSSPDISAAHESSDTPHLVYADGTRRMHRVKSSSRHSIISGS